MLVSNGMKESGVNIPIKLSSVPNKHSSIRIFFPATPNLESSITSLTHFFASSNLLATKTPLPAANPSAFKTIGKLDFSR